MRIIFITILGFVVCWLTNSLQAQNVLISDSLGTAEPSINFDPSKPNIIVAGSNTASQYYSHDYGKTWQRQTLISPYGVWGDPVIELDNKGHFYFFHLSNPPQGNWIDRIVCQKSMDGGKTWTEGTYTGLNGTKAQDKHWSCFDKKKKIMYLTWTQFDKYGSVQLTDKSNILFSKSTDFGETWSKAKRINRVSGGCIDDDNTTEGAVPAVGPKGQVYVAWAGPNGLTFNKSEDQGESWLNEETFIDSMPGGWDLDVPGIYRANGLPITKCDLSTAQTNGTIYVNWTDQRNGLDDTDVWLAKSTDEGETWSKPIRVNDDLPGKHQFFTWMDIDQTNGYLYFVFYDRRNYTDNMTDVYLAISKDGGKTFENKKISDSPFEPSATVFFGDYTNIRAHNGMVRPIWTRADGRFLSLWTDVSLNARVTTEANQKENSIDLRATQYPNPSKDVTHFSYKLRESDFVSLRLFDFHGRLIYTVIDFKKTSAGKYVESISKSELGLSDGIYHAVLTVGEKEKTFKMVFE